MNEVFFDDLEIQPIVTAEMFTALERDNAMLREAMTGLRSWFEMRIEVVDAENARLKAAMKVSAKR